MESLKNTKIEITEVEKEVIKHIKTSLEYKVTLGGCLLGWDKEVKVLKYCIGDIFRDKMLKEALISLINKGILSVSDNYIKVNYML